MVNHLNRITHGYYKDDEEHVPKSSVMLLIIKYCSSLLTFIFKYNQMEKFVTLDKQSQDLEDCLLSQLYDIQKQHQNEKIYKPTNNNLRTSSNSSRANQDNSPRINRGTGYDNQRAVNIAGARENVGTPVVQKSGI
ncbi:hypothetical protein Tco_0907854 [Tanacetum coccineum]|uniref:Uncharacterized protein n=1 Tax=Tanacetum coccineum TaxID=301880 RepID=A0ABQ5CRX7_9ASTR